MCVCVCRSIMRKLKYGFRSSEMLYAAYIGSCLPTFRDGLSIPFSRIKQSAAGFRRGVVEVFALRRCYAAWDVMQRMLVVYRRFGTDYRSYLQGSSSPDCLTLEDVIYRLSNNYQRTLRDIPEDRRSELHYGGSFSVFIP